MPANRIENVYKALNAFIQEAKEYAKKRNKKNIKKPTLVHFSREYNVNPSTLRGAWIKWRGKHGNLVLTKRKKKTKNKKRKVCSSTKRKGIARVLDDDDNELHATSNGFEHARTEHCWSLDNGKKRRKLPSAVQQRARAETKQRWKMQVSKAFKLVLEKVAANRQLGKSDPQKQTTRSIIEKIEKEHGFANFFTNRRVYKYLQTGETELKSRGPERRRVMDEIEIQKKQKVTSKCKDAN